MFAFDPDSFLTEAEELDCENTIKSLLSANEKIDYYLWHLKYEIFCDDKKYSKLGTFADICKYLRKEHDFPLSVNTCYDRALAYKEKRIITDKLGIDISHLQISGHALQELRKIKDLARKELVLKKALKNAKNNSSNQITEPDIKIALSEVEREEQLAADDSLVPGSVQLKLIGGDFTDEEQVKQKQSRVGQVSYLYISGAPDANLNLEEKSGLPQYRTEGERLEYTIIEDTTAESDTSRNSFQSHNQGLSFPKGRIFLWNKMRFRSTAEIAIAYALDCQNVEVYFPNCIARCHEQGVPTNKEPDFLVIHKGRTGILEVDGPHHTSERRVLEQERERFFRLKSVRIVERYEAQRCINEPHDVVREFLRLLTMN
ncbi:hypothetical protein NIES2101_34790 [Calothrix sp. HK-06]|nr:hypothetical protein NIES2101_34790 [Calothrix sp. HK-06]